MRHVKLVGLAVFGLVFSLSDASAMNTPCSGSKGGVKACQGSKFLCNNGTLSRSKRNCSGIGGGAGGDVSDGGSGGASGGKGARGRRR